jgi:hypothetical protein
MRRRAFLGSTALGLAAAAWPSWLRRAFADASVGGPGVGTNAATNRQPSDGKPVLAIIIPSKDGDKYERGRAIGRLINHGSDEEMAALALCEVWCVPPDKAPPGEPWMVLLDGTSAPFPISPKKTVAYPEELPREQLADPIHLAVMGTHAMIQRRVDQARVALGPAIFDEARRAASSPHPETTALPVVDRAASIFAAAIEGASPERRTNLLHVLAEAARARLRDHEIPGSRWARSSGCGTDIENAAPDEQNMIDCGMAMVPAESRRFLWFYTRKKS